LSFASSRKGVQLSSHRKISLVTGLVFIITIIASIPALILFGPVLNDPNYVTGSGADTRVFLAQMPPL